MATLVTVHASGGDERGVLSVFELQNFLGQQRAEGQHDSSGAFTLAVQQATTKLARFALPRPEAWVLKLLQAASGWGVKELRLTQTKTTSRFTLRPSLRYGLPRPSEIVQTFLSGDLGGHDPLSRFCLALRALGEQTELPFLLVIDSASGPPSVVNSGFLPERQVEVRASSPEYLFPQGVSLTLGHLPARERRFGWLLSSAKPAAQARGILQELLQQSPFCSVPLVFDSRVINAWDPNRLTSDRPYPARLIASRAIRTGPRCRRSRIVPPDFQQGIWSPGFPCRAPGSPGALERESDGLLRLWNVHMPVSAGFQKPSLLRWVADGVVVGSNRVAPHGPLYCELLVDASDLPLDLTGLALVGSPQYHSLWSSAVLQFKAELDRVLALDTTFSPEVALALRDFRHNLQVSSALD